MRRYVKQSLWVVPALAVLLGGGLALLDIAFVEDNISLPVSWQYSSGTASTVLAAVVSAMAGLTGIVVAIAILIIQMATGTLSPRYMRIWYRDPLQKAALAGFLGTMAFAYALLRNTDAGSVPSLGVTITGISLAVSMILFLRYIDRFAHLLRPVALSAYVAEAGAKVIGSFGTRLEGAGLTAVADRGQARYGDAPDRPPAVSVHSMRDGVVQAIDVRGLLGLATRHDSVLLLRCTIGDFLPRGGTLIEVIHGGSPPADDSIRRMFEMGTERDFEQDPAFALRIIVDIAIRALSPAVNDPTTCVQLLDYIERLLRLLGGSEIADYYELRDESGHRRVVLTSRSWDDYLAIGVTEILEFGSTSTQVTRRLRALLEDLLDFVHAANREAVRAQLARLDAMLKEDVPDVVRRAYASKPDRQGIGGPARSNGQAGARRDPESAGPSQVDA